MNRHALPILIALITLLSGCVSTQRPGTGDISFRLLWTGQSDLDLYVTSPLGERVDFVRRSAPSGGTLDIDCNVKSAIETNICSEPMENIFWPKGTAPEGEYRYWPIIAEARELQGEDVYKIEVRVGDVVVSEQVGRVIELVDQPPISTITFRRSGV